MVDGFDIYVKEKAVLGREHVAAFNALGYSLGERVIQNIEENIFNELSDLSEYLWKAITIIFHSH